MKLYITDIKNISPERINELCKSRAEKVLRYKKEVDRIRCIAGGLFINRFLGEVNVYENKYGKPVAENGVCFNISHSGDYVIFALSDCDTGCDIQQIRIIKTLSVAKIVFCENEIQCLKDSFDKLGIFYKLWTKKESLLKCIGEGFHHNSKSIDVSSNNFTENGKEYYFRTWSFSDYAISVCSEKNDMPNEIEFVEL